jgi:cyanate permease
LTLYQWAALAFVPLFVWLWLRDRRGEQPVVSAALSSS